MVKEKNILLVDDEEQLRSLLKRTLTLEGYVVFEANDLRSARKKLTDRPLYVILCDVKLPDGSGVDFVKEAKSILPDSEIILMTAYGNIPDGVQATKNGAFDYLVKGDDNDKIIPMVSKAMEKAIDNWQLKDRKLKLAGIAFDEIIGNSPSIIQAIALARKVSQTNTTVLLTGETGTGKEVFAQAIHHESPRKNKNFVAINCSTFSKEILETELFGYRAGAFTGALKDKKGLFEEANEGTLFLDEIGEIPIELQAKLLRVLETGTFIKVGDTKEIKVDVRVIAATNRDLFAETESGGFRMDLFYRLSVFQIKLPSLAERIEDIPVLAQYFLTFFTKNSVQKITSISPDFLKALQLHQWKG
ncbi:MAG: sigma-54 dependent transcriptional regulator, partial [Cytophagales bacterium]|nr:sigma-54 dependent transcriptional regulator [Cytophagales bacterium]